MYLCTLITPLQFSRNNFFKSSKLMHSTLKKAPHLKELLIYIYSIRIISRILRFIFVKMHRKGNINLQKTHDMMVH